MSDTRYENAVVNAIQIIIDEKIKRAGYDTTIKGVINKVLDKTIGEYQIKYQDSFFNAYSNNAKIDYKVNQMVNILIPGSDSSRSKIIVGAVDNKATTYEKMPIAEEQYNNIGPNGISFDGEIGLSSYKEEENVVISNISFKDITNYIRKGNSIAIGTNIRTSFFNTQIGGRYGLKFNLVFRDDQNKETQIMKSFTVGSENVIGNPYRLTSKTFVEKLITDIDTDNFIRVDSIQAFQQGFPNDESKVDVNDIFFSDITINGASALTQDELNGYVLHINCQNGEVIDSGQTQLPVVAELKVNGKIISSQTEYYWFRRNGLIFKGNEKYSGYAGDGWECLNYKFNNVFVPKENGNFIFTSDADDLENNKALLPQRVNDILCVAVYDNKEWIKGEAQIVNLNIKNNIEIISSDRQGNRNQEIYYLGNGRPTFQCKVSDYDENVLLSYLWSVKPINGRTIQKPETKDLNENYINRKVAWEGVKEFQDTLPGQEVQKYIQEDNYKKIKADWEEIQFTERIDKNIYYNFPINSIAGSSTIYCAVTKTENDKVIYIGTTSITLYNKIQLEGMYSLNLENDSQVFQYDEKGNSPTSSQLDNPLKIEPLTFTLLDNQGEQITYENIVNNGYVKWIIPNTQTLLISNQTDGTEGQNDLTVTRADLALPANNYTVYLNKPSFSYSIADRYDKKNNVNYIWLNVKYKDIILNAYTNFTFPKDGDPGTNGTDYISKIVPEQDTERIYVSNINPSIGFNDNGYQVDKIKFQLYNNSKKVPFEKALVVWTCPPKGVADDVSRGETFMGDLKSVEDEEDSIKIQMSSLHDEPSIKETLDWIKEYKPINIIRGKITLEGIDYFAEYPICYNYSTENEGNEGNVSKYRFKIKPQTGFKYVVYSSDGTRPDYDNTLPFEIVVEEVQKDSTTNKAYYSSNVANLTYEWDIIGNLKINGERDKKIAIIEPLDTFNGYDLSSAVLCSIKKDNDDIGFIHVPIYLCLNRYGHTALNNWDGNSIQLDKDGGSSILAPQIGAGKKNDDNSFTGIFMGDIKDSLGEEEIGLMGYQSGQRSIFLDAQTGKAQFGKQGASKIILDPSQQMNGKDVAFLYSNEFNKNLYKKNNGESKKDNTYGSGLMIDLTSPAIQFGSGHFYVNSNGNIHAGGGGDIAGWNVTDDRLYKNNTGMASSGWITSDIGASEPNTTDSVAFYAGTDNNKNNFYVTHNGYLFSKSGKIGGWDINDKALYNSNVGMNSDPNNGNYTSIAEHNSKAFFANGDHFYVTHDGYLRSTSGKIANWSIKKARLSDNNVGMGQVVFQKSDTDSENPFGEAITARFWGASNKLDITDNETSGVGTVVDNDKSGIANLNFAVSSDGKLYSKAGKIGGWNIGLNKLSANNININANGTIQSSNWDSGKKTGYSIEGNGSATFYDIYANKGKIGGANITDGSIKTGQWEIKSNGQAVFSNINVTGGIIKFGQVTITEETFKTGAISTTGGNNGSGGTSTISGGSCAIKGQKTTGNTFEQWGKNIVAEYISAVLANIQHVHTKSISANNGLSVDPETGKVEQGTTVATLSGATGLILYRQAGATIRVYDKHGDHYSDGRSGTITFSDGSKLTLNCGIITDVDAGDGAEYKGN